MSRSLPRRTLAILSLFLLALAGCETLVQEDVQRGPSVPPLERHAATEGEIDVEHYAIDLRLHPELRTIEGECTVRFYPRRDGMSEVDLDFEGLRVESVSDAAGRPLEFLHQGGDLTVRWPVPLATGAFAEVEVAYSGQPAKGLWFAADREGVPTQVFTQGECEDSRWWFPCHDVPSDRATSEVRVTMPAGWTSVAAGERIESVTENGLATEHWRMNFPHPAYLVTLVAGEFAVIEDEWNGVPLSYLVEPRYAPWAGRLFEDTGPMLGFFSELTGIDYPYPKYSQACVDNFPFGGMENISATTLTDSILTDERGLRDGDAEGLIAHEAAHQWFGNLLTCRDWSQIWLNEGFATYAQMLWVEEEHGIDRFRVEVRDAQEKYLSSDVAHDRRPIVFDVYRDPIDLFGSHAYPGGASRLHLLRYHVGDEAFFHGLRTYVRENAGRGVVTADFQRAMEQESGLELDRFFEQWLHTPGYPEFDVSWRWDEIDREVDLTVSQTHRTLYGTPSVFETPVTVELRTRRGTERHRLTIDERREIFQIAAAERPEWVRFDKYGWIPKRVHAEKDPEEWLLIAAEDDDVNGRRDALLALGALADDAVIAEQGRRYVAQITDRLRRDPVAAVRIAAARAAGMAGGPEARANLVAAASEDASADVRGAALEALERWGEDPELARFALEQYQEGYSWRTMGAAAGLFAVARPEGAYEWLTRQLFVDSPHDVLQGHLFGVLADLDHDAVRDQLLRWARDESLSQRARARAVAELAGIAHGSPRVAAELRELLSSDRFRLRAAVLEALAGFEDAGTKRALGAYYGETVFPREKRTIEAALGL